MARLSRTSTRAARVRKHRARLDLEALESRLAPSAVIGVNAAANVHAIDPNIYGAAFATTAQLADLNLTVNRDGGNSSDTYNWQVDATNHASDWYYESIPSGSGSGQSSMDAFVSQTEAGGAQADVTIPILPYVASLPANRSDLGSYPVSVYGAQQYTDPYNSNFGNGVTSGGQNITDTNPLSNYVANSPAYEQSWIQHLLTTFGTPGNGGVQYFTLGNEPGLWNSTHRDIHPSGETNTELLNDIISYGSMIKALDPSAQILGPEEWGWTNYFIDGADAAAGNWGATYNGLNAEQWLLQQLDQYQAQHGTRLLDYFTLHYYPQESVNGDYNGGIFSDNVDQATELLRNQVTRSLWDPNYVDPSWIGTTGVNGGKVDLIPMMQSWVNTYYPGTMTGITEYNFGAEGNMNGATTQADLYGIFGQQGLDLGTRWTTPATGTPAYLAMKLWRNYDGNDSGFGNTSVGASVGNPDQTDAFAALRSSDGALTVAVINKNLYDPTHPSATTSVTVNLSGFASNGVAQQWQLAAINPSDQTNAAITHLANVSVSGNSFTLNVPMESVTMFVIEPAAPAAPTNLSATAVASTQVNLAWTNNATNQTGFQVDRATNSTFSQGLVTVSLAASATSYGATGLAAGTTYWFRVRATNASAASANSNVVSVNPGAAAKLVFTTPPATTRAGTAIAPAVTVQIEDQFGNLVGSDSTDTVTVGIASGPGSFTGSSTTTVTASGGVATFSALTIDKAGGGYALSASDGSLTGATSNSFVVNPATAAKLGFIVQPRNTPGTAALNPAVQIAVEDTYGNVLTSDQTDNVTVALASAPAGGAFTGGSTTTATVANGIATFSNLHLTSAGSYTLSETATGGVTGPASSAFVVTLVVSAFTATPTGFTATFSQAFNPATINLTGPTGTDGPVAVTLVGSGSIGPVSGSLYLDPTDTQLTFVKTVVIGANGLPVTTGSLPLGTYTVTLVSGSSALTTTNGVTLDGNSDGTSGDNYTATFHVVSSSPAAGDVLLPSTAVLATAPDFARGPLTPSVTIAGSGGATESGNTVTITTTLANAFSVGQTVTIAGVGVSGYNGTFTITSVPTATTFTYMDPASGLAASGGGTANVPAVNLANNSGNGIPIDLTVLAPVQTVTLGSAITTGTTGTFKLGFNSQTTANITVGTVIKAPTGSATTSGASESGTTVTIRASAATGLKVGESVTINGVTVAGYNGTFTVTAVPSTTSFTYTAASGLGLSGNGTWTLSGGASLATAMQARLGALSVVGGPANVTVTGTGPFTVTFATAVANPNLITVAANTISGAPTIAVVNPNAPASVTSATLVLGYNANLLTITGATVNAALAPATFTVSTSGSGTAAQATITFTSSGGVNLGSLGSVDLGGLVATVPSTAPYKSKMLLHFVSESINAGALTAAGVDGYQLVAYQGDTDGNGSFSGNDQTLLNLVAGGTNPGFAAYRQVDPVLIGGLSSGTSISATDSGLMSSYLNGVAIPQVPDQTGVTPTLFAPGPDPTVSIPSSLSVAAGGTVVVPVLLDDARPVGSTGLTQAELALTYDPAAFTVSAADVQLGTIPSAGSGWTLSTVVDVRTGQIAITLLSQTPIATSIGGSLVTIAFHQIGTAPLGSTPIRLVAWVDPNGQGMFPTALFDTDNRFILSPAPTNGTADAVTALVVQPAAVPGPTMAMARAAGTEPATAASTAAVDRMLLAENAEVLVEAVPAMTVVVTEDHGTVPEAGAPLARAVRSVAPPAVGAGTDVVAVMASGGAAQQAAGLGFQFGYTSSLSEAVKSVLPLADLWFLALGRSTADQPLPACTFDETFGGVLPDLDWLPGRLGSSLASAPPSTSGDSASAAPGLTSHGDRATLDQSFAALSDDADQGTTNPSDE